MASNPASIGSARSSSPKNIFGRYRIIGRLGRGGMAEILLTLEHDAVRDVKRLVVVKRVLPSLLEEDRKFAQMFLDEARLCARMNHANIVQTFDVGEETGCPYMAIEFLEGQSLNVLQRRLHAAERKVPLPVALRIFGDVLEGLHYAHELKDFDGKSLGVVHRDVTPSNLFVRYDGVTKLVDFGIAKSATQREKTVAGVLKGKMAYMAPEQLRDAALSRAVDVWAMATVMWETLAGERLFRGRTDFETVQNVMRREIPKLSQRRNDVPPALDEVLAEALARDPAKRTRTADELKCRLEELSLKLGIAPRRTDVAALMTELFAEAQRQNQRLVKDFLETAAGGADNRYIAVKPSGALELRTTSGEGAAPPRSESLTLPTQPAISLYPSRDAAPVGTSPSEPPVAVRPSGPPHERSGEDVTEVDAKAPAFDERARISAPVLKPAASPASALKTVPGDVAVRPSAGRPAWHWVVVALTVLGTLAAVFYILR